MFLKCWLVKYFLKGYKVTHMGASGAQLTNSVQSYARVDLWWIIPKEGTKLHRWWLVAHNFWKGKKLCIVGLLVQNSQLRYEVLHTWACNAQLIQMTRSCAPVGYWFATLQFGFNLQLGNTVHNNSKIRYEIKPECFCVSQLVNRFKSFFFCCLACSSPPKDTRLCTLGLWCTTPTSCTNILTSGLAVHNSKIKDNVTQVLACDAQLLQSLQSFARVT